LQNLEQCDRRQSPLSIPLLSDLLHFMLFLLLFAEASLRI